MKKTLFVLTILALAGLAAAVAANTTATTVVLSEIMNDKVTVPLSKPGQPARVEVNLIFGSIKVVGYEGKDVIVEAKPREKSLIDETDETPRSRSLITSLIHPTAPAPPIVITGTNRARAPRILSISGSDKDKEKEQKAKSAGMKQIPLESSGLTVEEQNNVVKIELESFRRAYDVEIKVPAGSSLKLDGANLDSILVENVGGEIESETANGSVKLLNVSGPVTVNSSNGDIEVVLNRLSPDKPMSFATFNGDVDVTLPADAKANLRIKSNMGDLFSDFDVNLKSAPIEPEKVATRDGAKFKVTMERSVIGTINGGGPELKFQNWNGNIYIRKKK